MQAGTLPSGNQYDCRVRGLITTSASGCSRYHGDVGAPDLGHQPWRSSSGCARRMHRSPPVASRCQLAMAPAERLCRSTAADERDRRAEHHPGHHGRQSGPADQPAPRRLARYSWKPGSHRPRIVASAWPRLLLSTSCVPADAAGKQREPHHRQQRLSVPMRTARAASCSRRRRAPRAQQRLQGRMNSPGDRRDANSDQQAGGDEAALPPVRSCQNVRAPLTASLVHGGQQHRQQRHVEPDRLPARPGIHGPADSCSSSRWSRGYAPAVEPDRDDPRQHAARPAG